MVKLKSKIRVGIIGYGVVGKKRRKFIDLNKKYNLVCISDVKYTRNFIRNKVHHYQDYNNFNLHTLDAVFITLPNYLSAKVTKLFLRKKIHVFCEKPPARSSKELQSVIKIEKNNSKIKLKYGFNHRYHKSIILAKKLIDSNKFGSVINLRCVYGKSKIITFNKSDWRSMNKYSGGGILLDQGIHLLDLIIFFCGKFDQVKSFVTNNFWKHDVEDNAFALLRSSKKNIIASLHSTATQWEHMFRFEIFLEKAMIELKGILSGSKSYGSEKLRIYLKDEFKTKKNDFVRSKYFFKVDNSWRDEINEFADIIINDNKILVGNSKNGLEVMNLLERIYHSDKDWKNYKYKQKLS